tara:strand:+ start:3281 stop:3493 length:213 start_codon:yes stop_codon:yes gene_type:complete
MYLRVGFILWLEEWILWVVALMHPIKTKQSKQSTAVGGVVLWLFVLSGVVIWASDGRTMGIGYALELLRQ